MSESMARGMLHLVCFDVRIALEPKITNNSCSPF
jgi:hypothetical protein